MTFFIRQAKTLKQISKDYFIGKYFPVIKGEDLWNYIPVSSHINKYLLQNH